MIQGDLYLNWDVEEKWKILWKWNVHRKLKHTAILSLVKLEEIRLR
jgi:hypothetical protein